MTIKRAVKQLVVAVIIFHEIPPLSGISLEEFTFSGKIYMLTINTMLINNFPTHCNIEATIFV